MRKEKLEVNKDKKIKTSKWKNVVLSGLLAATLLSGCGDGKGIKNKDKEPTKTEQADTQGEQENNYISLKELSRYKEIGDGVHSGIYIYENPETMKRFIVIDHISQSNINLLEEDLGYKFENRDDLDDIRSELDFTSDIHKYQTLFTPDTKLSEEFDDIKDITRVGDTVYYIGINGGQESLYKNTENLFEGNDIEYRIINNSTVVVAENYGKKFVKWGDKILDQDCTGVEFLRDGIAIQKGGKMYFYREGELSLTITGTFDKNKLGDAFECGEHYVVIYGNTAYIDGKSVGTGSEIRCFYGERPSESSIIYGYRRFKNNEAIIKIKKNNGKYVFISVSSGQQYGGEYDDTKLDDMYGSVQIGGICYDKNHLGIYTQKNGKDLMVFDGEDFEILGGENIMILKKGNTIYSIDLRGNEEDLNFKNIGEFNYKKVVLTGKAFEGKIYFIGTKGNKEDFVIDGKVMGKDLDHISGAGLVKGGGVYVRGEKNGKKIFILNGTERGEDYTNENSQERDSDLFRR